MAPKRNKMIQAVYDAEGFDMVSGESPIFQPYSASYPSAFPPVKQGATNGHSYVGRADSPLCQHFTVRKIYANGDVEEIQNGSWVPVSSLAKERAIPIPTGVKGRALIAWWSRAFAPRTEMFKASIPGNVRKALVGKPCVFSGATANHIDHKYGRQDQANYPQQAEIAHFQPASKVDNIRKREHCNRCKASDKRFDARIIPGIPVGWVKGEERFQHNREGCVGCYMFDPVAFREALWRK
jgi:ICEA Protein